MKTVFLLIIIVFAIAIGGFFLQNFSFRKPPQISINNHVFDLYVAKSPRDQEIGLSKYENMPQNTGMLFQFGKSDYYAFWMRDMKFPLDIIFINNNRIVAIYDNVPYPKARALSYTNLKKKQIWFWK